MSAPPVRSAHQNYATALAVEKDLASLAAEVGTTVFNERLDTSEYFRLRVMPGLHSVRRTYATEMGKRIYASHARRGVYTPRVDLGAYTQTSTQYRLRTISGRWIYFICREKACVYA